MYNRIAAVGLIIISLATPMVVVSFVTLGGGHAVYGIPKLFTVTEDAGDRPPSQLLPAKLHPIGFLIMSGTTVSLAVFAGILWSRSGRQRQN